MEQHWRGLFNEALRDSKGFSGAFAFGHVLGSSSTIPVDECHGDVTTATIESLRNRLECACLPARQAGASSSIMRKAHLLIAGAWLVHTVAWFLRVVKEGVALPQGLPGWEAFRLASCAVWPYKGMGIDGWYNVVLSTTSAATTVLFVLGSVWVVWAGSRTVRRVSAWIAASAFIVNAHWF